MTEQTELLPCAHCGGEPHTMDAYGETWIHCSLCGVGFDAMSRQPLAELAAAWNRRAGDEPAPDERRELFGPGTGLDRLREMVAEKREAERRELGEALALAAIRYIELSPCDPDVTEEQLRAWWLYKDAEKAYKRAVALRGEGE